MSTQDELRPTYTLETFMGNEEAMLTATLGDIGEWTYSYHNEEPQFRCVGPEGAYIYVSFIEEGLFGGSAVTKTTSGLTDTQDENLRAFLHHNTFNEGGFLGGTQE